MNLPVPNQPIYRSSNPQPPDEGLECFGSDASEPLGEVVIIDPSALALCQSFPSRPSWRQPQPGFDAPELLAEDDSE